MNNCEIKSPPVFSQEIPKWDRNTYADGNAMGAVVEQLFNNTVYNKEELKEKVDTEGGDISETQVSVLDESTEAFPVPMSGDKAKGLWGKLKKWQQDCLAKFGNYVLTSMITNQHVNSTSNIPSSALVYLMQQGVTQLNRDLRSIITYTNFRTTVNIPTNMERDTVVNFTVPSGYETLCLRNIDTSIHPMLPISSIIISENSVSIGLVNLSGKEITNIELTGTVILIKKLT